MNTNDLVEEVVNKVAEFVKIQEGGEFSPEIIAGAIKAALRYSDFFDDLPIEYSGWQFKGDDGEWHIGSELHNHRQNTEEAGYEVREMYALKSKEKTHE